MSSHRDPFPSPKLENCFTLSGSRPQQRKTYDKPTHLAQTEEPWSRLHDAATVASTHRTVVHYEPQSQADSLDLHLASVYDHHKDFSWRKNQILHQETVSEAQRKQENLQSGTLEKDQGKDIRMWVDPQRRSIHSLK